MSTQPGVFLSYAREDRTRVEQVYDSLRAEELRPWMDTRDIMPGQSWDRVIGEAIREADFMLAFISRHSVSKRGYIQREIRAALSVLAELPEGAIFLIPVRLDDSEVPEPLRHIQWVDLFEEDGWRKLLLTLKQGLQRGRLPTEGIHTLREEIQKAVQAQRQRRQPHIFVAMPFSVEMEDIYYYAISRAVSANDLDCVRIDQTAFTGDMLQQIKTSIQTAVAVIAELSGANPNVHLELGYAWGKDIPTVLLLRDDDNLCFDVRGQKCIMYRTIKGLETALTEELARLKASGSIKSPGR